MMPSVVRPLYHENKRHLLEVCPLDKCQHEPGPKLHHIFEYRRDLAEDEFIQEALEAVAQKEG